MINELMKFNIKTFYVQLLNVGETYKRQKFKIFKFRLIDKKKM